MEWRAVERRAVERRAVEAHLEQVVQHQEAAGGDRDAVGQRRLGIERAEQLQGGRSAKVGEGEGRSMGGGRLCELTWSMLSSCTEVTCEYF